MIVAGDMFFDHVNQHIESLVGTFLSAGKLFHFGPDLGHLDFRPRLAGFHRPLVVKQVLGNPDQSTDGIVMLGEGIVDLVDSLVDPADSPVDAFDVAKELGLVFKDKRDVSFYLLWCHLRLGL
jgi:hypothetical protein